MSKIPKKTYRKRTLILKSQDAGKAEFLPGKDHGRDIADAVAALRKAIALDVACLILEAVREKFGR